MDLEGSRNSDVNETDTENAENDSSPMFSQTTTSRSISTTPELPSPDEWTFSSSSGNSYKYLSKSPIDSTKISANLSETDASERGYDSWTHKHSKSVLSKGDYSTDSESKELKTEETDTENAENKSSTILSDTRSWRSISTTPELPSPDEWTLSSSSGNSYKYLSKTPRYATTISDNLSATDASERNHESRTHQQSGSVLSKSDSSPDSGSEEMDNESSDIFPSHRLGSHDQVLTNPRILTDPFMSFEDSGLSFERLPVDALKGLQSCTTCIEQADDVLKDFQSLKSRQDANLVSTPSDTHLAKFHHNEISLLRKEDCESSVSFYVTAAKNVKTPASKTMTQVSVAGTLETDKDVNKDRVPQCEVISTPDFKFKSDYSTDNSIGKFFSDSCKKGSDFLTFEDASTNLNSSNEEDNMSDQSLEDYPIYKEFSDYIDESPSNEINIPETISGTTNTQVLLTGSKKNPNLGFDERNRTETSNAHDFNKCDQIMKSFESDAGEENCEAKAETQESRLTKDDIDDSLLCDRNDCDDLPDNANKRLEPNPFPNFTRKSEIQNNGAISEIANNGAISEIAKNENHPKLSFTSDMLTEEKKLLDSGEFKLLDDFQKISSNRVQNNKKYDEPSSQNIFGKYKTKCNIQKNTDVNIENKLINMNFKSLSTDKDNRNWVSNTLSSETSKPPQFKGVQVIENKNNRSILSTSAAPKSMCIEFVLKENATKCTKEVNELQIEDANHKKLGFNTNVSMTDALISSQCQYLNDRSVASANFKSHTGEEGNSKTKRYLHVLNSSNAGSTDRANDEQEIIETVSEMLNNIADKEAKRPVFFCKSNPITAEEKDYEETKEKRLEIELKNKIVPSVKDPLKEHDCYNFSSKSPILLKPCSVVVQSFSREEFESFNCSDTNVSSMETDEESSILQNPPSMDTQLPALQELFEVDKRVAKGVITALSDLNNQNGSNLSQIRKFITQRRLVRVHSKLDNDIQRFLKSAEDVGIIKKMGIKYQLQSKVTCSKEKVTNRNKRVALKVETPTSRRLETLRKKAANTPTRLTKHFKNKSIVITPGTPKRNIKNQDRVVVFKQLRSRVVMLRKNR